MTSKGVEKRKSIENGNTNSFQSKADSLEEIRTILKLNLADLRYVATLAKKGWTLTDVSFMNPPDSSSAFCTFRKERLLQQQFSKEEDQK